MKFRKLRDFTHTFLFHISFWNILCNVAIYFILGHFLISLSSNIFIEKAEDYTEKTLEQAAINLNSNLSYVRSSLIMLANNDYVIGSMNNTLDVSKQLDYNRNIHQILQNLNLFQPFIQDILILGTNGYVNNITSKTGLLWDYDYKSTAWYQKAIDYSTRTAFKTLEIHPQDFYTPQYKKEDPTISMSMIVFNQRKEVVGAVICNFNLEKLGDQLVRTTYEKNGKLAIIDKTGIILVQSDHKMTGEPIGFAASDLALITDHNKGSFYSTIGGDDHIVLYHDTDFESWKLVSYIPVKEITSDVSLLTKTIFIILCVCFWINLMVSVILSRHFGISLNKLLGALQSINFHHPEMPETDYPYTEFNTIADSFNLLMQRLDTLIDTNYRSKLLLQKAELETLQHQINPHFLFNTLQLLQTEILYENVDTSNEIIVSLSKILRYTTCNYKEMVTLNQELEYVKNYLLLFQKKEEGSLHVDYYIDQDTLPFHVPKLILQPIVENCVKYAFPVPSPTDFIKIQSLRTPNGIDLIVEDNGKGIAPELLESMNHNLEGNSSLTSGIGLRNVLKRIRIAYSSQCTLTISSTLDKGTTIILSIVEEKEI